MLKGYAAVMFVVGRFPSKQDLAACSDDKFRVAENPAETGSPPRDSRSQA
jgi:hypothetical protein